MGSKPQYGPAVYWQVDLHVHTPASADVVKGSYGSTESHDVVSAALQAGLHAIAITDHNTVAWCEQVAEAAKETGLIVLPGVEITTSEGHILGVWEEGTDIQDLKDVLVTLRIPTKDHGKLDISADVGFMKAAEAIRESDGLAIAAHSDAIKGLLKLPVASHRRKILQSVDLAALELVDVNSQSIVKNQLKTEDVAFVRGSDSMEPAGSSHTLAGIGQRRTWIKASRPDLRGIRHALQDPMLRVRLDDPGQTKHKRIAALTVDGGFLHSESLAFSDDLTCLLGGTGTGKSLVVELIRFVLDQQTPNQLEFDAIRSEVDRRLENALGTHSVVELTAFLEDGSTHKVRREFDEDGSPPPEVVEGDPETRFPIRAFSQGEIIEYARAPVGRMQLVDSGIDLDRIRSDLKTALSELRELSVQIHELRKEIREAQEETRELTDVKKNVQRLSKLFDAEVVKAQEGWAKEKRYFPGLAELVGTEDEFEASAPPTFKKQTAVADNKDLYTRVGETLKALDAVISEANHQIEEARRRTSKELHAISKEWKDRFDLFDEDLTNQLQQAEADSRNIKSLRAQLTKIQGRQAELEELKKETKEVNRPRLEALIDQRKKLVTRIEGLRSARLKLRKHRAAELNRSMGGSVKIKVSAELDDSEFEDELKRVARGSGLSSKHLELLAREARPLRLVSSYLEQDAKSVAEATGVPETRITALFEHVTSRELTDGLVDLEAIDIADGLRVRFRKPENNRFTDIENLAHGQKCTAILIIALAEGDEPLVIDQPEDALHAPWIEEYLVDRLRELRGSRQYLFATRSPGLVVSADAEMLITLVSRAESGQVEASGSLERHELNELALYHLEGGSTPFARRARKLSDSL